MKTALWIVQVILVVLCGLGCHGDGGGMDIGINVGNSKVDIDLSGIHNPCESHTCQEGQRCTVVYHPGFLDIPVAHCVSTDEQTGLQKASPGSCIEVKVGSNVMKCKTEEQWRNIGTTQCTLRDRADTPTLYSTQVSYACHRFDDSTDAVFLQATFTCCPRLPDPTPSPQDHEDADSHQQVQTQVANDYLNEDFDYEHNRVLVYPLLIAAATLVALMIIIITVAVWRRSKQRRPKHPKLFIATSFVNPSADHEDTPTYDIMHEYTGRSDKSLLIVNEHTEYAPGN